MSSLATSSEALNICLASGRLAGYPWALQRSTRAVHTSAAASAAPRLRRPSFRPSYTEEFPDESNSSPSASRDDVRASGPPQAAARRLARSEPREDARFPLYAANDQQTMLSERLEAALDGQPSQLGQAASAFEQLQQAGGFPSDATCEALVRREPHPSQMLVSSLSLM